MLKGANLKGGGGTPAPPIDQPPLVQAEFNTMLYSILIKPCLIIDVKLTSRCPLGMYISSQHEKTVKTAQDYIQRLVYLGPISERRLSENSMYSKP